MYALQMRGENVIIHDTQSILTKVQLKKTLKELLTKFEMTFYLQRSIANLHLKILFLQHYTILLIPK